MFNGAWALYVWQGKRWGIGEVAVLYVFLPLYPSGFLRTYPARQFPVAPSLARSPLIGGSWRASPDEYPGRTVIHF